MNDRLYPAHVRLCFQIVANVQTALHPILTPPKRVNRANRSL